MYSTFVALIICIITYLFNIQPDAGWINILALVFAVLILALTVYLQATVTTPLLMGEQKLTPRLIELFSQDSQLRIMTPLLFIAPLLFIIALWVHPQSSFYSVVLIIGVALDLLRHYSKRLIDFINPFQITEFLRNASYTAISNDQDVKLCDLIDTTAEVAVHAVEKNHYALANQTVDVLETIGNRFLNAAKSLSHPSQNSELKAQGKKDTLSYVLLFLLQRLEMIQIKATDRKMDLIASHTVTSIAKLATYAANADFSLCLLPLHYIDKCTLNAMRKGFTDVGVKATIGLLELVKTIEKSPNLKYQEIQAPMMKIITTLESVAKEIFRNEKATNIQILSAPFAELGKTLEGSAFKDHPDTPVLIQQINRILAEFQALEAVMKAMPPMPKLNLEEETETPK